MYTKMEMPARAPKYPDQPLQGKNAFRALSYPAVHTFQTMREQKMNEGSNVEEPKQRNRPTEPWQAVQQRQERQNAAIQRKVVQREPVTKEEAGNAYDSLGGDKWREFIDKKDHAAAMAEFKDGKLDHPGEYYNYYREGETMIKKFDSHRDFIQADHFVKSRIGKKITAKEYQHIHDLAFQPESRLLKGLRMDDATWGLPGTATEGQKDNIREKGLNITEKDKNSYTVHSPVPREGISKKLEALFTAYHEKQGEAESAPDKFNNIIILYQQLEALHAFKDGTSRTNHLLLNKLLSEHGLGPAIINEPDSPMFNSKDFGAKVVDGIIAHRKLVEQQRAESQGQLAGLREKHIPKELSAREQTLHRQLGVEMPESLPKFTPPRVDPDVANERIDLNTLIDHYGIKSKGTKKEGFKLDSVSSQKSSGGRGQQLSGKPPTLGNLDLLFLGKVMGPKKANEIAALYADQQRRYRDRIGQY